MGANKGVQTFHEADIPKVNPIAQLEHELAYYDIAVQHVSHWATKTSLYCYIEI